MIASPTPLSEMPSENGKSSQLVHTMMSFFDMTFKGLLRVFHTSKSFRIWGVRKSTHPRVNTGQNFRNFWNIPILRPHVRKHAELWK
tara:strand:+ start:140 stop:400 length:261 start_codon:yes stop_codon:yes gene_type:complete